MHAPAAGSQVAGGARHGRRVDVGGVQFGTPQGRGQCRADRTGAAAQVDHHDGPACGGRGAAERHGLGHDHGASQDHSRIIRYAQHQDAYAALAPAAYAVAGTFTVSGVAQDASRMPVQAVVTVKASLKVSATASSRCLAGKVVLEWSIGLNGRVASAKTKSSTLRNASVEACILSNLKGWQFPTPNGGLVIITYPFLFNSVGY